MLNINENQKKAIEHINGPMEVLAGPGSGKTTVILYRIKNLIENGIHPSQILLITFSKATATEIKHRFEQISNERNITFNTFHALFFRIIRNYYNFSLDDVIRDDEKKKAIEKIAVNNKIIIADEDEFKNIVNEISYIKNDLLDIENYYSENLSTNDFRTIFIEYEKYKEYNNKIDFDDMLVKCYELLSNNADVLEFWQNKYEHILVDEFQDINKAQFQILNLLAKLKQNIFIVGDDDQSIYRFRGARPEFLINFSEYYKDCKRVILNTNYRSTDEVIMLSNAVIKENKNRITKNIKGTDRKSTMPKLLLLSDSKRESEFIADKIITLKENCEYEDIAVIFRTNMQARPFIESFLDRNIPFQLKDIGLSIYEHYISKDIIAYLKASQDIENDEFVFRIINKPSRYINRNIIEKHKGNELIKNLRREPNLQPYQRERIGELMTELKIIGKKNPYDAVSFILKTVNYNKYIEDYANYRNINANALFDIANEFLESAQDFTTFDEFFEHIENVIIKTRESSKQDKNNGVILTTLHGAKGLEYENVFIAGAIEGLIPYEKATTEEDIEEERRLFYVGITRAKTNLFISILKYRHDEKVKRTRFLNCVK